MATYKERAALTPTIREAVGVAFYGDLTKELQKKPPSPVDIEAHKKQRVRQRWCERALGAADTLIPTISRMVAASATDARLEGGLDDTDIKQLVGKAIDALANVELKAESEVLPV